MTQLTCFANHHANVVAARARVHAVVRPATWLPGSFGFEMITKPYAHQRPSGAPPG